MEDLFFDNFYSSVDRVRRYMLYTSFTYNKDRREKLSDRFFELSGLTREDVKNIDKIDATLEIAHKGNMIFLNFTANYNNYISQILSINRDKVYDIDSNMRKEYSKIISNWGELLLMMHKEPFKFFTDIISTDLLSFRPEVDKKNLQKDIDEVLHLLSNEAKFDGEIEYESKSI